MYSTSIEEDIIERMTSVFDLDDDGVNSMNDFIQSFSILPSSYPGHSLLTEDIGISYGIDDCPCRKKGRYFKVLGRLKKSELRGCSDVY